MNEEFNKFKNNLQEEQLKNTQLNRKLMEVSQELKITTRHKVRLII